MRPATDQNTQSSLEIATQKDLRDLEHRIKSGIDAFEYRITVKLGGLIILFTLLVVFFQKVL